MRIPLSTSGTTGWVSHSFKRNFPILPLKLWSQWTAGSHWIFLGSRLCIPPFSAVPCGISLGCAVDTVAGRWVLGHLRVDVVEIIARIPSENLILRVFFFCCLQPPNACFWKCEIPMPLKSLKFRFHREKGWKDEKGWLNQWMWHSNRRIWGSPRTSFQQQGTPLRRPDLKWVNRRDVWRKPSGYLTVALWLFNSLPWKITIFNR